MIREACPVLTVDLHAFAVEHSRQPAYDDTPEIRGKEAVEVDIQRVRGQVRRIGTGAPPLQVVWQEVPAVISYEDDVV